VNTLTSFVREHRDEIVQEWLARAMRLPTAEGRTPPSLRDHVPAILDLLADAVDRGDSGPRPLGDLPEQHALVRFHEGYDLRQVVAEYRLLREVIAELYTDRGDLTPESRPKMKPLRVMHEAVDRAIGEAVDQYALERDRVRDRFIAILGHDLRDPLNAILFTANAQLSQLDELDSRRRSAAARTKTAAERMDRMIRDLLDFARCRLGGGFTVVPTRFDARTLIVHAVHDVSHAHPGRDVQCSAEAAAGDFDVNWDSDRIAQVVANLLGNALSHGRDPVIIQMADQGDEISIEVSNRGEIPRDLLPRLFDPFVEAPNSGRHGLGLGLYIVQQIARAHGGKVSAESSNGTTTMKVALPRRAQSRSNPL
jgi:signal transduction histidine kinase